MPSWVSLLDPCGEMTAVSYSAEVEYIPFPTNEFMPFPALCGSQMVLRNTQAWWDLFLCQVMPFPLTCVYLTPVTRKLHYQQHGLNHSGCLRKCLDTQMRSLTKGQPAPVSRATCGENSFTGGTWTFPGTWNYIIYISAKATSCWLLVLSCYAFHFLFLIISTAIHLLFHSLPSFSCSIMVK